LVIYSIGKFEGPKLDEKSLQQTLHWQSFGLTSFLLLSATLAELNLT